MRDSARLQSAIEILDAVICAAQDDGAAADTIIARWFAAHRFAGSKDKAAIRDLVWAAVRVSAERPESGRAAIIGMARAARPELLALFDGSEHGPQPLRADEPATLPSLAPKWMVPLLELRFGTDWTRQAEALAGRAPLDLRVNPVRADVATVAEALGASPIAGLSTGLRLDPPAALDRHPLFVEGAFEVQDAGSQHVAELAAAKPGEHVLDLCAGAGGKTLALAAAMRGQGHIIATDTDRGRLSAMGPRLNRAGVAGLVETRLLNPGQESSALSDIAGAADLVLVDAPCTGTGTWRRNPELRWRLTPSRLERLLAVQARLIALGVEAMKPGGRLVYAVCSVLEAEGAGQVAAALETHGLRMVDSLALTPANDGCDGFFVASLARQ